MRFRNKSKVILFVLFAAGVLYAGGSRQNFADHLSRKPYGGRNETLTLKSRDGHNGLYSWKIVKDSNDIKGDDISRAGYESDDGMNAVVPGTVLNTLVYNEVYPEPYYGLNNSKEKGLIPDIADAGRDFYTYWFRTEFELTEDFENKQILMQLDGINYRAEIWLNGSNIGKMAGMFKREVFDITEAANYDGKNALAVLVKPVDFPGRSLGRGRNGGNGEIGKNVTMLMTVGWDFTFFDGIRDRNTGIWRNIKIVPVGSVELRNPFVKSELSMPDMESSSQEISVNVVNHSDKTRKGILKAAIPEADLSIKKEVEIAANESKVVKLTPEDYESLVFENPRLWWPLNKGEQHLYELKLTFEDNGTVSDIAKTRFGVRHITTDRDTPDDSRQFYVNGERIFLHGTNWIPEAMLRKSEERTYAELRYTRQAGINFIRFWAGGIAETDYFFDLCDELGIMVSMEFWLTGDTHLPVDQQLYRENVKDTIKRLRNHPSLAYYISANERGFDNIIPVRELVNKYDGTRGYQPGSEVAGIHDGSPYKYVNPMFYYDDSASNRGSRIWGLCPEYGAPILPTLDSLKEMMDVNDIYPVNETVWNYLDGGGFHDMVSKYVPAIKQYGEVDSAEELAWKGQMVGAVAYRGIWESWTYNKLDCGDRYTSGLWYWYHNSPNRQVCGRMWDWSLEPTAGLYYSQDAHEPIHAQYDFIKNTVSVNNEYYEPFEGSVKIRIFNMDMTLKYENKTDVEVGSDVIVNDVIKVDLPSGLSSVHFIRLDVYDTNGKKIADTFYWRSDDEYEGKNTYTGPLYSGFEDIEKLPQVELDSAIRKKNGKYIVTLKNPSEDLAFMIRVKLTDPETRKPIRPTFYTDNFFSLLPDEEKTIEVEPYEPAPSSSIVVNGWNVKKLNSDL